MADPPSRQPTGDELKRLQDAILYAYNFESLKQMTRLQLEEDLLAIVPFVDQGLKGMVHDLVFEYASRPGGLHQLIRAARSDNPTSADLAAVADELLAVNFNPLPPSQPTDRVGDKIAINAGEQASYVAAGKNVTQVIQHFESPPPIDPTLARTQLAALPLDAIPPVSPLPTGSHLPFAPNPYFTGRQNELAHLAVALKGEGDGQTVVINQPRIAGTTGMGGVGKSQLAAAFAHRYGRYFLGGVAWISLADAGSVPSAVVNACLSLPGLPPQIVDLDLPDQVRLIRQAWASELPRLLIFDNCEEETLLAQWRPTSGAARVLVTSRRSTFDGSLGVQLLPLRTLPRPDSIALLRRFRPDLASDDPELDAIADELGDLPLALHLAGSFLKRYANTVAPAAYLIQLRHTDPLAHRSLAQALGLSPTDHDLSVARTFALSLDRLDAQVEVDGLALALLARAAQFAPGEPIPRSILLSSSPDGLQQDPLLAEDAFIRLVELGLLDPEDPDNPVLHRLLARFVRARRGDNTAQADVEQTIYAEANRLNREGFPSALLAWQTHLRYITDTAAERTDEQAARLCSALDFHLSAIGDLKGALPYSERALALMREVLGEDHPDTALSLNNLGSLLQAQGDLAAAKPYGRYR